MKNLRGNCSVTEKKLVKSIRLLSLKNDMLEVTILPDKGADIYECIYLPKGIDVLWKTPWGLLDPAQSMPSSYQSTQAWIDSYPGGWQVLFPNGGAPCTYKGVELNFHGEAALSAWNYEILESGGYMVSVRFDTRLRHSPFRIERTLSLEAGNPILYIHECITNVAGEPMDFMWVHHPAFGAPFISEDCRIDIGARSLIADDKTSETDNPLKPGERFDWPYVNSDHGQIDLSQVPDGDNPRQLLAYFDDFESGWYAITNPKLGLGVGMAWSVDVFPYAWFWQEMYSSSGYPWYKNAYVMAIEPSTTIPAHGLSAAMEKTGSHRTLSAGESLETELIMTLYESENGVQRVNPDGTVVTK